MNIVIQWSCTHVVIKDYLRRHKLSVDVLKRVVLYLYAVLFVVEVFEL